MRSLQIIILFFGRLCMSAIFLLSGIHKIFHWKDASEGLMRVFSSWAVIFEHRPELAEFFSSAIYFSPAFLSIAIAMELIGGIFLLTGFKARTGAVILALFLLPTTFIFHHFWYFTGLKRDIECAMFLKNIAILGGLLYVIACGESAPEIGNASEKPHTSVKED